MIFYFIETPCFLIGFCNSRNKFEDDEWKKYCEFIYEELNKKRKFTQKTFFIISFFSLTEAVYEIEWTFMFNDRQNIFMNIMSYINKELKFPQEMFYLWIYDQEGTKKIDLVTSNDYYPKILEFIQKIIQRKPRKIMKFIISK